MSLPADGQALAAAFQGYYVRYGLKRALDLALASVGLLVAAPVLLVCAAAIRRASPGPALFRQQRVGRGGAPFVCFKLRTMFADTASLPTHEVRDAAITPLGRRLRSWKLDELPQLWNVLRGEMSFVGPRPCLPSQTVLIALRRARGVDRLRPGITGVAQAAGVDMSDPERLAALDATYLEHLSLGADLRLIVASVLGAGRGDRVRAGL